MLCSSSTKKLVKEETEERKGWKNKSEGLYFENGKTNEENGGWEK